MKSLTFLLLLCFVFNSNAQSDLIPFYNYDTWLWGYQNDDGEKIIDSQFKIAREFREGVAYVETVEKKWGHRIGKFINSKGENVYTVPEGSIVYPSNQFLSEGLIAVYNWELGKFGFINLKGEEVIPFEYNMAFNFSEGKAVVVNCDEKLEELEYGEIDLNGECKAFVINKSREVGLEIPDSLFDKWNNTVRHFPLEYREGLLRVSHKESGKIGFIDTEGNIVIPCKYDTAGSFNEGLAFIGILHNTYMEQVGGNVIGYIDRRDKLQIQLPDHLANLENGCFFYGGPFRSGRAYMSISENDGDCVNGGFIVIDSEGTIIEKDWR